ncbi:MAG TPA: MFS transporter, partial [Candidatus Acidoferrales bacterium]|nr:MFS transporter [Candidatus Acidoferrales bacterium]
LKIIQANARATEATILNAKTINVPDLIDAQKVGAFQVRIMILCALAAMLDGFAAQMIGYIAPSLAHDLHLSPSVLARIFSVSLIGLMLGALSFGPIADRFGRRRVIVGCTLLFGVFTLATAFAHSVNSLIALRFLAGLGFGGVMPNTIALTAEYSPQRRRGTMITIMFCGFPIGATIVGFVAVPILPAHGWRGVFVLAGVMPLLLVPVLALLLPESIRHLVMHGKESSQVRKLLARVNPELVFSDDTNFVVREERAPGLPVLHLFRQGRALATVLLWIAFFVSLLDIYLLSSWLPTVFHNAGITLSLSVAATAVFQGGGVVASLILGIFIDRFGAFRTVAFIYLLGAVFVALLGHSHSIGLIMLAAFFAGAGIVGGQTGTNVLAATLYPTYIRSTGVGWGLGIGRIGSILGPIFGGIMLSLHLPLTAIFLVAAASAFTGGAAIYSMGRVQPVQNVKNPLGSELSA